MKRKKIIDSRNVLILMSFLLAALISIKSYSSESRADITGLRIEKEYSYSNIEMPDQTLQIKTISGTVIDDEGEPVIGASVSVKGTTNGVMTDVDGRFTLSNVKENDVIRVTLIGYKEEEIEVRGKTSFVVILKIESVEMQDVVIVGYGTQKKESVVGAISTIKPAELQRMPVRSLTQALAGNLAGLISLQSSGEPGKDDAQFWIRGISTFTGNQNPLVLVDGIERPLENVDPLEIESFSVLKDASATAVYGVRGANGVVLINTKRGFEGKAKIDIRLEQGFTSPTKRLKFVDAATRSTLFNEAVRNSGSSESLMYSAAEIEAMRNGSDPEL